MSPLCPGTAGLHCISYFSTSPSCGISATSQTQAPKQRSLDAPTDALAEADTHGAIRCVSVQMQEALRKADLSVPAVMSILKGAAHGEGRSVPHNTGTIIQRVQELQKMFGKVTGPRLKRLKALLGVMLP